MAAGSLFRNRFTIFRLCDSSSSLLRSSRISCDTFFLLNRLPAMVYSFLLVLMLSLAALLTLLNFDSRLVPDLTAEDVDDEAI